MLTEVLVYSICKTEKPALKAGLHMFPFVFLKTIRLHQTGTCAVVLIYLIFKGLEVIALAWAFNNRL